jgi:hypothetical protein
MAEWFYKATPKKVSFDETRDLAINDGFICRSAYTKSRHRVGNTQAVKLNDTLHVYYIRNRKSKYIGSFNVVHPKQHKSGGQFAKEVPNTALFEVSDEFNQKLKQLGETGAERYMSDPVLETRVGWPLEKQVVDPPPIPTHFKQGRATLVRRQGS